MSNSEDKTIPCIRLTLKGHDDRLMHHVPGGPLYLDDAGGELVSGFFLDERPVTNADFQRFLADEANADVDPPSGWRGARYRQPGTAEQPVTGVSVDQALRYAHWAGKRLPTLWEWQRAARGDLEALEEALDPFRVAALGRMWEWTSSRAPLGRWVCGGVFRDRPREPASSHNLSFQDQAATDVGFRCARDITLEDARVKQSTTAQVAADGRRQRFAPLDPAPVRLDDLLLLDELSLDAWTGPSVWQPALRIGKHGALAPARVHSIQAWTELGEIWAGANLALASSNERGLHAFLGGLMSEDATSPPDSHGKRIFLARDHLPGVELWEHIEELHQRASYPSTEVIALLGVASIDALEQLPVRYQAMLLSLQLGFDGGITPSPFADLPRRPWPEEHGWRSVLRMTPEMVRGERLTSANASYLMGYLLYQMASGQEPNSVLGAPTRTLDLIKRIALTSPPPLRELRPDLPDELTQLVDLCLAKDPERRPAHPRFLHAALRSLLPAGDGAPVLARWLGEVYGEEVERERAWWRGITGRVEVPTVSSPWQKYVAAPDVRTGMQRMATQFVT